MEEGEAVRGWVMVSGRTSGVDIFFFFFIGGS